MQFQGLARPGFQFRDPDRDYQNPMYVSCSPSDQTQTGTANCKVSVSRPRMRPRILISRSRLRTGPRLNVNNCEDIWPHQGHSMEINHQILFWSDRSNIVRIIHIKSWKWICETQKQKRCRDRDLKFVEVLRLRLFDSKKFGVCRDRDQPRLSKSCRDRDFLRVSLTTVQFPACFWMSCFQW